MKRGLRRRTTRKNIKNKRGRHVKRGNRTIRRRVRKTKRNRSPKRNRKRFNSRIRSIFKRSLRRKQRGGHNVKDSNDSNNISSNNRGGTVNTLSALRQLPGGMAISDHALLAENSIGNVVNNFTGQAETMSPSVTSQPIGQM